MPSASWHPTPPFLEPSEEESRLAYPSHMRKNVLDWQSIHTGRSAGGGGDSGLPTPPSTEAMTGMSLNHLPTLDTRSHIRPSSQAPSWGYAANGEYRRNRGSIGGAAGDWPSTSNLRDRSPGRSKEYVLPVKESAKQSSAIASYLQIPSTINDSKASLAEFAAQITCLFWFESAGTLSKAEESDTLHGRVVSPLAPDALPTIGFLKWVTTMLTTTQVTQNVILLALMFIYRLKKFNSGVSGKKGSEYRLLTIALMLGNKFLDDNTYTNKTWAEVSGISVSEIHIMEVEFLSNMRYNLFVSKPEWLKWQRKLARFSVYLELASRPPIAEVARAMPPITPTRQTFSYKLPSPPSPARHGPAGMMPQPALINALAPLQLAPSPANPYVETDYFHPGRKRATNSPAETPSKRLMSRSNYTPVSPSTAYSGHTPNSDHWSNASSERQGNISRVPSLPIPQASSTTPSTRLQPYLAPLTVPSGRAMSIVYPNTSGGWSQPVTPINTVPNNVNVFTKPIPHLADPSRSHHNSAAVSPNPAAFSIHNNTATPDPNNLSPSYFLTHRNSPYRPVRHVNTLLIPPPSASLHHSSRPVPLEQMRYQPLTKNPTEPRAGVVPYVDFDVGPQQWMNTGNMLPSIAGPYTSRG